MADSSMLMNNDLPVNGVGVHMPSAGMAFSNGPDMQGKVLPQNNAYNYPMYGVGATGDMAAAHLSGVPQMGQVNDSSSWMGPMGQSASMVPPMQPYAGMMGQQPFQNPSQFNLPANMANPPSAIPPSSQMNAAMQFGTSGQFPYGTWPNDQGWMQHAVGGQPQTVKPAGNMPGMGGMDVQASPSVADMASQSLPDLGDVGLADGKARSTSCRELVNGDVSANANSGPQPGMAVFNSMVSPSPVGPSQATDASGAKMLGNHSVFGHDGMVNSSAGAMMPSFPAGMQPTTVAVTTQHAAAPMHSMVPRHPMAAPQAAAGGPLMSQGMMYPSQIFPRMPMDSMMMPQPAGPAQFPTTVPGGMTAAASSQPSTAPTALPVTPSHSAADSTNASGNARCPKNIGEVLQPLYKLGDEPDRKPMLDRLVQLSQETGTPTLYVPTLASDHTHVDLFRLYEVIRELGGLVAVVRKKVWRRVIESMGLQSPSNVSALASTLRTHYTKLLLPLECKENNKVLADEIDCVEALRRRRNNPRGSAASAAAASAASPASRPAASPDVAAATSSADTASQQKASTVASSSANASGTVTSKASGHTPSNLVSSAAQTPMPSSSAVPTGSSSMATNMTPPSFPGMPSMWPNQPSPMQPPSFPPQPFPHADHMSAGNHVDGSGQASGMFPEMAPPMDPYMGFPSMQAGMMPAQMDGAFNDPRMMYNNPQFQQWRQHQMMVQQARRQQHILQQQQQQQQQQNMAHLQKQQEQQHVPPSPLATQVEARNTSSVSSLNAVPSTPVKAAAAASQSSATHGDTPGSHAAVTPVASTPSSVVKASGSAQSITGVYGRLLSGGSVDSVLQDLQSSTLANAATPVSPAPSAAQRKKKKSEEADPIIGTDPSAVENTAPVSVKRKRFSSSHLAHVLGTGSLPNLWRLHMCLKAGLLAESAQALDVISIIVSDEHTLCLFQLPQQPTVLETLLAHIACCLHSVFGGFNDISLVADGDAMRRFYPEDPSNADIARQRDEEYDTILQNFKESEEQQPDEAEDMDQINEDTGDKKDSQACSRPFKKICLPDGLRHIATHLGSLERDAQTSTKGEETSSSPEQSCSETLCAASTAALASSSKPTVRCPSWLRHGTAVEAEPSSLTSRTSSQRLLMWRAKCVSNLTRSLSFLSVNERHMSRHFGLMTLIARVCNLFQDGKVKGAKSLFDISSAWWWPSLELIRADLMVTLVNISGQVDLSSLPSSLVSLLIQGLCHWCVSSSPSARDPLPAASSCPGLSLQRLALESLSKISIGLGNISQMFSALPEASWKCLCGRLVQWLLQKRQTVPYELSLVLLCGMATCDEVSRHICEDHHCVVTLMMQLLSETESILCSYGNGTAIPDNPNMASIDLMRRAVNLLLTLSKQRCNRHHFAHYQSHILILAASPFIDASVHMILVDLLYQIGLDH